MDEANIQHIQNWDTQDDQAWSAAVQHLSWPFHLRDEKGALSGVDCMIIVIQQILRSLSRADSQRLLRHRGDNFLIDLAIRDFACATFTQRENMQNARDVFWGVLCRARMRTSGTPTFLDIDQSPLMQRTPWGEPDFQAFHESFVRPPGADEFKGTWSLDEYPSDLDSIRTSRSLLTWDTSLYAGREEMIAAHFRQTHLDGQHGTYTFQPRAPKIGRILLDPTKARLEDLDIYKLYRMPMATRSVSYKRREDDDGSTAFYSPADVTIYSLIAVVRLRRSQNEHDYVRLYDPYGHQVVPARPADECSSYHSDDWSIADQDHQFMLYYAHICDPGGYAPPPRYGVVASTCVPPDPSAQVEITTPLGFQAMPAPWVRQTATEVASPVQPPARRSGGTTFDSWAAAFWAKEKAAQAEEAEKGQGRRVPHPQAQGQAGPGSGSPLPGQQAAGSSTQPRSSRHSASLTSLPTRSRSPSAAPLPSSAQLGSAAALASPTAPASSVLQGKPPASAPSSYTPAPPTPTPAAGKQPGSRGWQEVHDTGDNTGEGQAGSSHEPDPEPQEPGRESRGASGPARKKRKTTAGMLRRAERQSFNTYSSSASGDQGATGAAGDEQGD